MTIHVNILWFIFFSFSSFPLSFLLSSLTLEKKNKEKEKKEQDEDESIRSKENQNHGDKDDGNNEEKITNLNLAIHDNILWFILF